MAKKIKSKDEKKNRSYPKERKPRKTEYSTITQLINKLGIEKVKEISTTFGTYSGAMVLSKLSGISVPDRTILGMRNKFGWVRVVSSKDDCNARSIINGKVPVDHFRTIKFSEDITNEVF